MRKVVKKLSLLLVMMLVFASMTVVSYASIPVTLAELANYDFSEGSITTKFDGNNGLVANLPEGTFQWRGTVPTVENGQLKLASGSENGTSSAGFSFPEVSTGVVKFEADITAYFPLENSVWKNLTIYGVGPAAGNSGALRLMCLQGQATSDPRSIYSYAWSGTSQKEATSGLNWKNNTTTKLVIAYDIDNNTLELDWGGSKATFQNYDGSNILTSMRGFYFLLNNSDKTNGSQVLIDNIIVSHVKYLDINPYEVLVEESFDELKAPTVTSGNAGSVAQGGWSCYGTGTREAVTDGTRKVMKISGGNQHFYIGIGDHTNEIIRYQVDLKLESECGLRAIGFSSGRTTTGNEREKIFDMRVDGTTYIRRFINGSTVQYGNSIPISEGEWYTLTYEINHKTKVMSYEVKDANGNLLGRHLNLEASYNIDNNDTVAAFFQKSSAGAVYFDNFVATKLEYPEMYVSAQVSSASVANPAVTGNSISFDDEAYANVSTAVPTDTSEIKINFGTSMIPETLTTDTIRLLNSNGESIAYTGSSNANVYTMTLAELLDQTSTYTIYVSDKVLATDGDSLGVKKYIDFTTDVTPLTASFTVDVATINEIISAGGSTTANITYENGSGETKNMVLYVAYYDSNNAIVDVDIQKVEAVYGGTTANPTITLTEDGESAERMIIYLWDAEFKALDDKIEIPAV